MVFDIKKEIKLGRPNLSTLSITTYAQSINRIHGKLVKDYEYKDLEFKNGFVFLEKRHDDMWTCGG